MECGLRFTKGRLVPNYLKWTYCNSLLGDLDKSTQEWEDFNDSWYLANLCLPWWYFLFSCLLVIWSWYFVNLYLPRNHIFVNTFTIFSYHCVSSFHLTSKIYTPLHFSGRCFYVSQYCPCPTCLIDMPHQSHVLCSLAFILCFSLTRNFYVLLFMPLLPKEREHLFDLNKGITVSWPWQCPTCFWQAYLIWCMFQIPGVYLVTHFSQLESWWRFFFFLMIELPCVKPVFLTCTIRCRNFGSK